MDLEAIWQTHKRFILQVGGGALAFLVLALARNSLADEAARLAKANASKELALRDKIEALRGAEGREKGRAETLAETIEPSVLSALRWKTDPAYTLPAGESSPTLFYATALSRTVGEVQRAADRVNAVCPRKANELGLAEEVEEDAVPAALAKAELVRTVVTRALALGVREITYVEPDEASYEARRGDDRFLRLLPIKLGFVGDVRLLSEFLAEFQREGRFLELVSARLARESEKHDARLTVELELRALTIVDRAPAAAARPDRPSRRPRGPRRFGRDR
ncbi:MAG: hypothetical protein D6731_12755 [Planctomycetota bacterium]|nr:MAG: hypothetical protein D6731_12755 [Planctomycetota bacterium]